MGGASGLARRAAGLWAALVRHRVFVIALTAGAVVRVITMLGFPPAIWFGGDSASYLSSALRLTPGTSRVSGYGLMLLALEPLHSFAAVTALQHLMGLAVAVMVYTLLRRYGLPGWGATLAALPVLAGPYQVELEHEILPSAAFAFLMMVSVTLTMWWHRGGRPPWAAAAAGSVLAAAATFWPAGIPMLIVYLLYLLVRRAGWRGLAAAAAAAAVPLAGYMLWFDGHYHRLAFSNSDGIFLWSRTMSFASCAVIRPPPSETALCPRRPVAERPAASAFIWEADSPLADVPGRKFSPATNALARRFALRAIAAQPGGYARSVLRGFSYTFYWNIPAHPSAAALRKYEFAYAGRHWISPGFVIAPGHTVAGDQRAYGGATRTRVTEPFAGWMRSYQERIHLPGTVAGVALLAGLAGILRSWRHGGLRRLTGWGGPGLYPWLASLALLLVPVMTADFSRRYNLIAVPVVFLAAGLTFASRGQFSQPACAPRGSRETIPAPPA